MAAYSYPHDPSHYEYVPATLAATLEACLSTTPVACRLWISPPRACVCRSGGSAPQELAKEHLCTDPFSFHVFRDPGVNSGRLRHGRPLAAVSARKPDDDGPRSFWRSKAKPQAPASTPWATRIARFLRLADRPGTHDAVYTRLDSTRHSQHASGKIPYTNR